MGRPLSVLKATLLFAERLLLSLDFAALEVVEGNLSIISITTAGFVDLSNIFPSLDSIRGDLLIQHHTSAQVVQTITGFASLDSIGGDIRINNNTSLRTISGFEMLTTIAGSLRIGSSSTGNGSLTDHPYLFCAQGYWRRLIYW